MEIGNSLSLGKECIDEYRLAGVEFLYQYFLVWTPMAWVTFVGPSTVSESQFRKALLVIAEHHPFLRAQYNKELNPRILVVKDSIDNVPLNVLKLRSISEAWSAFLELFRTPWSSQLCWRAYLILPKCGDTISQDHHGADGLQNDVKNTPSATRAVLILQFSHAVSDGLSIAVLLHDLRCALRLNSLGPDRSIPSPFDERIVGMTVSDVDHHDLAEKEPQLLMAVQKYGELFACHLAKRIINHKHTTALIAACRHHKTTVTAAIAAAGFMASCYAAARCLVPVNLRPPRHPLHFGHDDDMTFCVSSVLVSMPGVDPHQRHNNGTDFWNIAQLFRDSLVQELNKCRSCQRSEASELLSLWCKNLPPLSAAAPLPQPEGLSLDSLSKGTSGLHGGSVSTGQDFYFCVSNLGDLRTLECALHDDSGESSSDMDERLSLEELLVVGGNNFFVGAPCVWSLGFRGRLFLCFLAYEPPDRMVALENWADTVTRILVAESSGHY